MKFKEAFFKKINNGRDNIASWYANNRINNFLKHNLFKESKSIEELKKEVQGVVSTNKIEEFYKEMKNRIDVDLSSKNYGSLIKHVNIKKVLTRELAHKYIINKFEERFIKLLDSNSEFRSLVEEEIVKVYFSELVKEEAI
ncbi:hypothetical protein [Peribacillus sp. NPDC097295]|uniref:hypothetical protein n=1 Tax=Peribacillus sp. NPDC097295 TaxID=3364402 RepID=UPI0038117D19